MSEVMRRDGGGPERKNPLRLLPEAWRDPAGYFFAFHSDLLKGTAGVAARLTLWIREEGLTLGEAKEAMKRLMKPERCAEFQYAGQLLAALAGEVAAVVRRRKDRERLEQQIADRTGPPLAPGVRDLLRGLGRLDTDGEADRG